MPAIDSNTKLLIQNNGFSPQSKAIFFDGSGDSLSIADHADWDFGTGDFTIECWAKKSALSASKVITDRNNANIWQLNWAVSGTRLQVYIMGSNVIDYTWSDGVANKWYHIAVSRSGSTLKLFINGKQVASVSNSSNITGTADVYVGNQLSGASSFDGWIKQFRISNSARYTTDFTPSISLFADDSATKLLVLAEETNGATTFVDSETTPKTITTNGNCVLQYTSDYRESNFIDTETTAKLITDFDDAKIVSQLYNKSAGFFSDSSRVDIPDHADWDFGTGDFTLECWIQWTGANANQQTWISREDAVFALRTQSGGLPSLAIGGSFVAQSATANLVKNNWYHVAGVRSGTSCKLYINGLEVGSGTSSFNISSANILSIGSEPSGGNAMTGWIKEVRISNSARYSGTFTPSTTQFSSDANTKLLLHFDTPATAPLAPAIKFDGSGDYLSAPDHADWDFGTGDFTLETWIRFNNTGGSQTLIEVGTYTANSGIQFQMEGGTTLRAYINGGSADISVSISPVANRWYHYALVRSSSVLAAYVDGVQLGTSANSEDIVSVPNGVRVGNNESTNDVDGWMKNVRISNSARYTAAFTPSQTPFTADANTKLLLLATENNGATTFVDSETTPKTVTTNGNTVISYEPDYRETIFKDDGNTGHKPFGVATTRPKVDFFSVFGTGAAFYDGSGDKITTPTNSDFAFGTGAFTVEIWIKPSGVSADQCIFANKETAGEADGFGFRYDLGNLLFYTSSTQAINVAGGLVVNVWHHIAFARSGSTLKCFKNGTELSSVANSVSIAEKDSLYIGNRAANDKPYTGWVDNASLSNAARYTATFNPPTEDITFGASGNMLLVC